MSGVVVAAKVFFAQALLDRLMDAGRIDVHGDELTLVREGVRLRVHEAVQIVREATTGRDPLALTGKVKPRTALVEAGAELLGDSMLIEDSAYDVVCGLAGEAMGEAGTLDPTDQQMLRGLLEP
jgi:hypothetical protein